MADQRYSDEQRDKPSGHGGGPCAGVDRRSFLDNATTVTMAGGLAAAYGTLAVYAGRYLYPSSGTTTWMFVTPVEGIEPGGAIDFQTPGGLKIVITRTAKPKSDPNVDPDAESEPIVSQFLALSSTCPHLGCRVHWESQNNRFFCPCHNGAFDAEGKPTEGPPKSANQRLPLYALKVEEGMLFIEAPAEQVGGSAARNSSAAVSRKQSETGKV